MSKLKLASLLLLAAILAGCSSSGTTTGSIGNGNDNGGNNGDGGNGDDTGNGGDNGNGGDGGNAGPTTYSLNGHFLRFSKTNGGDNDAAAGEATVTVAPDGATAGIEVSATGLNVPGATAFAHTGSSGGVESFGTGADNFLDLDLSGENYQIGTYVTNDAGNIYVGAAAGGDRTPSEQISASATYSGTARGAVIPHWTQDVGAYELTGDANLDLTVAGENATVAGAITNLNVDYFGNVPGQITLNPAAVADGAYTGTATLGIQGATTTGAQYQGAFYGENAAETAGTFHAEGVIPTDQGMMGANVIGSFGASKN